MRFADDYLANDKIKDLGPFARLLDVAGIIYSARELRDGHLTATDVRTVATLAHVPRWSVAVAELCSAGRWVQNLDGSYCIHDYLTYQPSRDAVLRERVKARDRKRTKGGMYSGGSSTGVQADSGESSNHPVPVPGPGPGTTYSEAPSRARAPNAAEPRRAPTSPEEPPALRPEQQQCPLCPEVFPDNAALRDHVDNSPRHKVRPEPETFKNPRRNQMADPEPVPPEVLAKLPPDLVAEHERSLARERSLKSHD